MSSIWSVRRSATDTKLAGVCGGVAAHWGVDPVLVRVGWALLALTGGVGIVLYVAGWLLIPVEGQDRSTVDDLFGGPANRWSKEVWVTLVAIACVVAFAVFSSVSPFGIGPALVLAVVWYFGFYRNRSRDARRRTPQAPPAVVPPPPPWPGAAFPPAGPPTPFTDAALAWQARVQQVRGQAPGAPVTPAAPAFPTYPAYPPAAPVPEAAPVDERAAFLAEPDPVGLYAEPEPEPVPARRVRATLAARRLRLITLVVLGLALAGLAVAGDAGVPFSFGVWAATSLLVVGLALIVSTWVGRARGLVPLGVLFTLLALVGASGLAPSAGDPPAFGERHLVYASVADLPANGDHLDGGELTVDLRGVKPTGDYRYSASLGTGRLVVTVPPGTGVRLGYDVGLGQAVSFGNQLGAGRAVHGSTELVRAAKGQPTLELDLSVDRGQLELQR